MGQPNLRLIQKWVKTQVSSSRLRHIRGVVLTAQLLAQRYRLSRTKALLAAWLHDCGKELTKSEMKVWIQKDGVKLDRLEMELPALWHPHAGAEIARHKWGIKDKQILEAIRCHTLGHPRMGTLAQLIFVADFIEKGRNFPGVDLARQAARKSLKEGVLAKASMTMVFLFHRKKIIHPRLLDTWNNFL